MQELQLQDRLAFAAVQVCFAGMAGVKEKNFEPVLEAIIRKYVINEVKIVIENDALIALYAGTLGKEGIVQIAGTGAITMGFDHDQSFARVGGWGYLFDDEGSGYDLGIQALKAVFQAYDGRAKETQLTEYLLTHFDVNSVPQLIEYIYNDEHPRVIISPLSIYVNRAAEKGDRVAMNILNEVCKKFFFSIKACYGKMSWEQRQIPVVLAGGVFSNAAPFIQRLEHLVKQEQLPFQMKSTLLEPIGGAVVGGLKTAGIAITPIFVEAFQRNYSKYIVKK